MPRLTFFALLAALLPALGGCDTFGLNLGGSSDSAVPPAGRMIDYRTDDLANLVFALDVPTALRPVPGGTTADLSLSTAKGEKHIKATLVLADGDGVESALPAPGSGRTYVMFGFAEKDKQALKAAQKWLTAQPTDDAPVSILNVVPKLCEAGNVDPTTTTYSILPVLPGTKFAPVVDSATVDSLAGTVPDQLAPCRA